MVIVIVVLAVVTLLLGILAAYRSHEHWSAFGTVVGGVGTALALAVGVWSFLESAELQREVTALTLYREHLGLSIEEPLLARAACSSEDQDGASQLREKYGWFVAHGLHSFESILEAMEHAEADDREEWVKVIEEFVDIHRCYFDSRDFVSGQYDEGIMKVVESVMNRAPRETNLPWRKEALQGGCIPGYEAKHEQAPWCSGFSNP